MAGLSHRGARALSGRSYTERMKSRDFDPLKLDIEPFAKDAVQLEGEWPSHELDRLIEATPPESRDASAPVAWQARGEYRQSRGNAPQLWVHLKASTSVTLQCQRCLQPVDVPVAADRSFLFVHGEDAAAALDAESEDDVLAVSRAFNLQDLIEDELLLELPLVPRHEVCPQPLRALSEELPEDEDPAPHPFAALAALKRGGLPN